MQMLMNIETNNFLEKLLSGEIESLSKEDKDRLLMNKQEVANRLMALFAKEISSLEKENTCENPQTLFLGLHLAGVLEISAAYAWLRKLCYLPDDTIDECLGIDFITEELPYLLASTMKQWEELKSEIENTTLGEFVRSSCLNALVFASVNGTVERSEIIHYFKSLFIRILNGDLYSGNFSLRIYYIKFFNQ